MTLADRIAAGFKLTMVGRVVHAAANGALLLVLTRYLLEPDQYGLLYFAISVVGIAELFGTLGVPNATARYVNEYLEKDERQVRYIIRWSLAIILAVALSVSVVVSLAGGVLADLLGRPAVAPVLTVGGLYIAGRSLIGYLKSVFQAFNRVGYSAGLTVVNSVTRLAVTTGLVVLGYGVTGAMAGYVVGFFVAVAVGLVALYANFYRSLPPTETPESDLRGRIARYSVPTAATRASVVLDSKIDTVLVGILATPAAVAFYTLARQIADLCIAPAQSLGFTITPTLGEQSAAENSDTAGRIYGESLRNVLLLYVPAAAGLVVVAEPTIRYVVGTEYLGAVALVQLYALFVVVRAVHKITGSALDYLGLAQIRAIARGTSAGGNFLLNLLLIPPLGALGAGIATVITYSAYTGVNVYYIHRELQFDIGGVASDLARVAAIALVMVGVVVSVLPHVHGIVSLAAVIATGGAVWATLAVASGLVEPSAVLSFIT
ncbi:oligosaccharide flippase family protein [Haloarcula sp. S1CR25-12]|uniref:Oligosaccharide flippase family protein n=1 Tax=Haloarcula saliterrae TaxID=2950534 RepID=A0ABU2F9M5_9EURY|nr:oligosaccharide flippase family protein [Haloarcula sp. S1CR25-12]MDS0258511.1 oligosaccharide flippase family protein [Haloarcula sp. S1CR25-12]